MCGINGIYAYRTGAATVDREELLRTRDHMRSRGPDGCGDWLSPDWRVGLGHRRLAIIDLSDAGAQPMSTPDGRLHVTFNGEIYNYREVRDELAAQGVALRSNSDTEVLLHLYRRDGAGLVQRLRGMFAFAIWDALERRLFLARDPHGIKPLYYAERDGVFKFASQVKALLAGGTIPRELDPAGVAGFLLWGSVPDPLTIRSQIRALPAGCTLTVTEGGVERPRRYWDLATAVATSCAAADGIKPGEEVEMLRAALADSVRAHMVADVPVGAFLSAGVDSTTIVGFAQSAAPDALRTITLTSDEFSGTRNDEAPLARKIAAALGVSHACLSVDTREFDADYAAFVEAMDQPTIDGLNVWFVSKAAAGAGLKVALSGLGGDELFGGYPSFQRIPATVSQLAWTRRVPMLSGALAAAQAGIGVFGATARRAAARLAQGGSFPGAYLLERGVFMPWELREILEEDFARAGLRGLAEAASDSHSPAFEGLSDFAKVLVLESSRYMRNQLLRDSDWAGMAHSLEIRVPFVDRTLTETVAGLAASGRLGPGKSALWEALDRPLPPEARERPKTGFTVPLWKWLRNSAETSSWKRIRLLRRQNVQDYNRWAYTLLARMPEAAGVLA